MVIFWIILALKLLECLYPFSHGDALNYHLVIAKLVMAYDWNYVFQYFFPVYLAGYFELIYFIPVFLFKNTLWAQLAGQLIHFLFSAGLAVFLSFKYIKDKRSAILTSLMFLTIAMGGDFLLYAKNDGVVASLCLWIFFIIHKNREQKEYPLIGLGLLFGIVPAIKLSGVFVLIPLFVYLALNSKSLMRSALTIIGVSLFVYSPVLLIKHIYLGGAYFYPSLLNLFPGNLPSETITSFNEFTNAPLRMETFVKNTLVVMKAKWILLLLPPLLFIRRRELRVLNTFYGLTILSYVLYLIVNGGVFSERFLFPIVFIEFAILGLAFEKLKIKPTQVWPILILIFIDSKVDKSIKRVSFVGEYFKKERVVIREEKIPQSKIWNFVTLDDKAPHYIFSDKFAQIFYGPDNVILDHYPTTPTASLYTNCQSIEDVEKYRYFILSDDYNHNPTCAKAITNETNLKVRILDFELRERK